MNPTPEQKSNLQKLADYLATLPQPKFDMFEFSTSVDDPDMVLHLHDPEPECGTVGCAAGSGPAAGIPITSEDTNWFTYIERAFGISIHRPIQAWEWLFSATWRDIDNTPQGAAKRIKYFLKYGVPEDAEEQLFGDAPYLFSRR